MKYVTFENCRMQIDKINSGHIDYGVGLLRGVTHFKGRQLEVNDQLVANIETIIDHIRAAARLVDRVQRQQLPRRKRKR